MNIAVAVTIYFHTIVTDYDARLDAYICHIGNVTHGMVIDCGAASEHKINRIRSPTRLYHRLYQCSSYQQWQPTSILSLPTTIGHYLLNFAILTASDMKRCFMDDLQICLNEMGESSFFEIGDHPPWFSTQTSFQCIQARSNSLYYLVVMKLNVLWSFLSFHSKSKLNLHFETFIIYSA